MSDSGENHNTTYPKPLEAQFEQVLTSFQKFIRDQTSGSILLILCTVIALFIDNSPFAHSYENLVNVHAGFVFGEWSLKMSVRHWINEGLMSLFFFVPVS